MIEINRNDIAKVIEYSQGISNPKVDSLLDVWTNAKWAIMSKFLKGEPIYRYPELVSFELNDEAKRGRYDHFVEYIAMLFGYNWSEPFIRFLQDISIDDFYHNSLSYDYRVSVDKKIQAGTKIIKAFKYFISDEKLLRDIQNKASELLQENKVEGYLTFSVHPLDFLSSSENTFNWRSCHALDGEYRAGNLSYMCDSSTVVCYLQSGTDTKLPNFPSEVPWNNKKWRCLLHFDTSLSVVFAGRQYPFNSPGALDVVRGVFYNELVEATRFSYWSGMASKPEWSHWHNDYLNSFQYTEHGDDDNHDVIQDTFCFINGNMWNLNHIVKDAPGSKHFNDLLRSSCYLKPYYMFEKQWGSPDNLQFNIGAEVKCLACGEYPITGDETMMCYDCNGGEEEEDDYYCSCDCCGNSFYEEEGWWVEDEYICPDCYERETFTCECCGGRYFTDKKQYDQEKQQFICKHCYEKRMEE